MIPTPNNNVSEIVEGTADVAILQEMMHEAASFSLDGRPHADSSIRGYMGDFTWSSGRQPLVIDTTNFIGKSKPPWR